MKGKSLRIGWYVIFMVVLMFSGLRYAKASVSVTASAGDKASPYSPGNPKNPTASVSHDNLSITCYPLSGWRLVNPSSATITTGGAVGSATANGTGSAGHGSMTLINKSFTLKVRGKAVPINPTEGTGDAHWWVQGNGPLTYWISPAAQQILPVGNSQLYTSYLDKLGKTNTVVSNWQYQPAGGSFQNGAQGSSTYNFTNQTPSLYTIKGTWHSESDTSAIWLVGIEKVQYKIGNDPYQDVPDELVICKGADVTFKAIRAPSNAPDWPDGKPIWLCNNPGVYATEIEEIEVHFGTASSSPTDYKHLTVECGNTIDVYVVVLDLAQFAVADGRTSSPEELVYEINDDEHVEIGGTFQFELALYEWPEPIKLGYELWKDSIVDDLYTCGAGNDFSHTFGTGTDGDYHVTYYFDNNTSNNSYTGTPDPQVDSNDFDAQEIITHSLTFAKSSAATGTFNIATACADAGELALKKDAAEDYRATVCFQQSGSLDVVAANGHDPMYLRYYEELGIGSDIHGDATYFFDNTTKEIIIVSAIVAVDENGIPIIDTPRGITMTSPNSEYIKKCFLTQNNVFGSVFLHEYGHKNGLHDLRDAADVQRVMYYQGVIGLGNIIVEDEVDNFED